MSTVIVCLDGASNTLVRNLGAVFEGRPEGWTWGPSPDSLTALRVAQAILRSEAMQQERRQVWEARQGEITESITLWDLPRSIYSLAFLNAEEDSEPETFGRRVLENKPELDALLDSMTNATTICVAINATELSIESAEVAQRSAWLLRSIFRFAALLPCGKFIPLIVCDEDRPSTSEEEWLKTNLPLLSSLDTPPKVFFTNASDNEAIIKLILTANPAVLATYEQIMNARQALCDILHRCETWTPMSDTSIRTNMVRNALNAYIRATKQLRWPLSPSLFDDGQSLPDLNAVSADLDTLKAFIKKAPTLSVGKAFSTWLASAPKLKTVAGKGLLGSTKKRFTDAQKNYVKDLLPTAFIFAAIGLFVLLIIIKCFS